MDQQVWTHQRMLNELVPDAKKSLLTMEWSLAGYSKSALRTGFRMGPFNLDAGHSVFGKWNACLISHGHADHIFSLASLFLVELSEPTVVMAPKTEQIKRIAEATLQSNYNDPKYRVRTDTSISSRFIDAVPGLVTSIQIGKDNFTVRVLEMDHSIPTAGYCVSRATSRLNPELQPYKDSLDPPAFASLMKCLKGKKPLPLHLKGLVNEPLPENITVELWHPQFCFLTDTSIKGIINNIDIIKEYPIIIVECTFYDQDDIDHAVKKKHIHWNQLEPFIRIYSDSLWILVHSSTRYKDQGEIIAAIHSNPLPAGQKHYVPSNCIIWI